MRGNGERRGSAGVDEQGTFIVGSSRSLGSPVASVDESGLGKGLSFEFTDVDKHADIDCLWLAQRQRCCQSVKYKGITLLARIAKSERTTQISAWTSTADRYGHYR